MGHGRTTKIFTSLTDLPNDFVALDDLYEDYPGLTLSDWRKFLHGIGHTLDRYKVKNHGRVMTILGTSEHLVEEVIKTYTPPKADQTVVSLKTMSKSGYGTENKVLKVARDIGISPSQYIFSGTKGLGFSGEQAEKLLAELQKRTPQHAPDTVRSISNVIQKEKVSWHKLQEEIKRLGIEPKEYRFSNVPGKGLTVQDQERLEPFLAECRKRLNKTDVETASKIAARLGMHVGTLHKLANGAGIETSTAVTARALRQGYSPSDIEKIKEAYKEFSDPENQVLSLKKVMKKYRIREELLFSYAEMAGVVPKKYKFSSQIGYGFTCKELEQIDQATAGALSSPPKPPNVIAFERCAKELNIPESSLDDLLARSNMEPMKYRLRNGSTGRFLEKSQQQKIQDIHNIR